MADFSKCFRWEKESGERGRFILTASGSNPDAKIIRWQGKEEGWWAGGGLF